MLSTRTLIVLALGAVALAALAGVALQPDDSAEKPAAPEPAAATMSTTEELPQGDFPEKGDGPIAAPGAGRLAGAPVPTARRFVAEWLNRSADAAELRRQRPLLVGLATGEFAALVQVTIDDALATRRFGPENEGRVLTAVPAPDEEDAVLVVAQERPAGTERLRYTNYLVRLARVGAGYAITALEPQQ